MKKKTLTDFQICISVPLRKTGLKICRKFTGKYPCRRAILLKFLLQSNFIEIALRHGSSPVNMPYVFGTAFLKNTSGGLLLDINIHVFNKWGKFVIIGK